jgi:hypothetical protein
MSLAGFIARKKPFAKRKAPAWDYILPKRSWKRTVVVSGWIPIQVPELPSVSRSQGNKALFEVK